MRIVILFGVALLFSFHNLSAQIVFNPGGARPNIVVSGTQTGNDLRTFIQANPAAGTVVNNDITFNAELIINNNAVFTDNNAVYHFPGIFRYAPRSNCTVNFTDITIHYSGNAKSHSYNQAYTANFTRVFYLQGVTSGRSDFFNNGNYTFNMDNVTMVSYGGSDFLHFQTNTTLNNITIVNANGGLNFEPGARAAGDTEIINGLKLLGVTRMVGGSGSQGDFKTFDMEWDATNWNFSPRNVDFFFVNPIKPAGWTGYSGGGTLPVQEFYTHDLVVTDTNLSPLNGLTVTLYNVNGNSFDYTETTDAQGTIPKQEVLRIDNTVATNFDRGTSVLVVPNYLKNYYAVARDFNEPIVDNVVITDDEFITETNTATVGGYTGINIDHAARTVTVSANRTLCELYDFIKLNKLSNLTQPSIDRVFATPQKDILDIDNYRFELTGSAVISPCDKFVKIESSVNSSIADLNNLNVGLEDASQLYKFIQISNLTSANLTISDNSVSPSNTFLSLTNYTGVSNSVTQFASNNTRIDVTRDGYTDWSAEQDFSGPEDIYRFVVYQAPIVRPATSTNQDDILFIAKKILMKNEGILQQVNGTTPNVTINNITQNATLQATEERQIEILDILKRILTKTTVIKKRME
ncbi:hypothetical protein [Tenacibaculum sp. M341]|uniref:hypothetical protein n=1 Tax=Tenacibaculum sp. M341 TaxID=2530339 RepID=UPI00104B7A20|nr:hypothetical protein [Tenacibaculum sp. M341]TCI85882.1 hypothetical protein EYW44_15660 [Tenacibaculum sp. M341]